MVAILRSLHLLSKIKTREPAISTMLKYVDSKCDDNMRDIPIRLYNILVKVFSSPTHLIYRQKEFALRSSSPIFSEWHKALSKVTLPITETDFPNVTICAVTFNSEKWIDAFLDSVLAQNYPQEKLSIHFVDHGSTDSTLAKLSGFIAQPELGFLNLRLDERPNKGYGAGNDYAIRHAQDEFVLVTNVDIEFQKDSLKSVVNVAMLDEIDVASWEFRQQPYEHPKYYDPVTCLTNWSSHACVLMRKSAYLEVGGYEQKLFMYGEDVELSYRFRVNGWLLRYVPDAIITHYVDLDDLSVRPQQMSGSIAANILLRYRYGSFFDILEGEILLIASRARASNPEQLKALKEAMKTLRLKRAYFWSQRKRKAKTGFSFNKFHFDRRRDGEKIAYTPQQNLPKKDMPWVSIFTYADSEFDENLLNTITSVLNQTYKNTNHIIIGDFAKSGMELFEKIERSYPGRVQNISSRDVLDSNLGQFEYQGWLRSGNLMFAEHIEILVDTLMQNNDADCAQCLSWNFASKPLSTAILDAFLFKTRKKTNINNDTDVAQFNKMTDDTLLDFLMTRDVVKIEKTTTICDDHKSSR